MTKTEKLLRFIAQSPNGRSLKEMQAFLCTLSGRDPNKKTMINSWAVKHRGETPEYRLANRGMWCVNLYGGSRIGLLKNFCLKIYGRWIITEPIEAPFSTHAPTPSFYANKQREKDELKAKKNKDNPRW